jgi:hypothetical protein
MLPPSSTSVQTGGKTTQIVKIFNPTQVIINIDSYLKLTKYLFI